MPCRTPIATALTLILPWLVLEVTGIWLYFAADPKRWNPSGNHNLHIPYISGLLGDGKDSKTLRSWRCAWWIVGVAPTVCARLYAWHGAGKFSKCAHWMVAYSVAWGLCVASAQWDVFEETNPLPQVARGDTLHFACSLVFFIVAGTQSYFLSLWNLFPRHRYCALFLEILYIFCYCCLFVLSKKVSSLKWIKLALVPILEHLMLWIHISVDTFWIFTLVNRTKKAKERALRRPLLLQASGDSV